MGTVPRIASTKSAAQTTEASASVATIASQVLIIAS
jgi:hypothetical protein